jgi:Asp-tRNA(Asn)/Glu-tRNA(Gln) amidotransferase A subunit family amidase
MTYSPQTARYLCFADARRSFADDKDTPRAFLERCIEEISRLEPTIKAFVSLDLGAARTAADAATSRWRAGRPLSAIDGIPVGIKDCFDVRGYPTRANSALFEHQPPAEMDAAHAAALRKGGAIIVGKTVTTELTMASPGPTWNPWDTTRTPGGSSSGSAAAVAARMLPIATGSQVRGSVIRPASLCGILGFKPTFGALNRHGGVDPSPSLNHLGILGGTLLDVWDVACHIADVAGGDPGYRALASGPFPAARRPVRLARQYTCGWPKTDEPSKQVFEQFLKTLAARGIEIVEPDRTTELAEYEKQTAATPEFFFNLMLWEIRWPFAAWHELRPDAFSDTMKGHIENARKLMPEDYTRALQRRDQLRAGHRALAGKVDGFITLAHIGPAQPGQPPLGTPWYNDASSAVGAPTVNLPLLQIDGVPLGVQLMGFEGEDADLIAMSRWLLDTFAPQIIAAT